VRGDEEVDLRRLLQRLATSAGDPPEHGFERVAARRHRRLRRRRGAVVTAVALAVLATSVWLVREPHRPADVAAVQVERSAGAPTARLPDRVEVTCSTGGIDVPVASVRPRRDGLHLRVHNAGRTPVTVQVDGEELMRLDDPEPLRGRGHDHFGFNDWEAKLAFDDLRITPL